MEATHGSPASTTLGTHEEVGAGIVTGDDGGCSIHKKAGCFGRTMTLYFFAVPGASPTGGPGADDGGSPPSRTNSAGPLQRLVT